ncbi:MAG: hypothetical protein Kow006_16160 [Gammaproteobacteria bacterium]
MADYALVQYPELGIRYLSRGRTGLQQRSMDALHGEARLGVRIPEDRETRITIETIHPVRAWWRDLIGAGRYAIPHALASRNIRYRGGESAWFKLPEGCEHVEPDGLLLVGAYEVPRFREWRERQLEASRFSADLGFSELVEQGQRVYRRRCAACHGAEGEGGDLYPSLRGNALTLGPLAPYLRRVLHGVPGSPMKAFKGVLNATELAALMTHQRNAWGHDSGDVIQPAIVEALLVGFESAD